MKTCRKNPPYSRLAGALEQFPFNLNREFAVGFCLVAFSNAQPVSTWSENALGFWLIAFSNAQPVSTWSENALGLAY